MDPDYTPPDTTETDALRAEIAAAREALAASEREASGLMTELTSVYKTNTIALDALGFYANGWPNGVDGGNKAREAVDAILALVKKPEIGDPVAA
jgi:hypothetical protein